MNHIWLCGKGNVACTEPDASGSVTYLYPENGLMPEEQVAWSEETVARYVDDGRAFYVCTVSPYVLKALEVVADEREVGEDMAYYGPEGRRCDTTQELFRLLSNPFSRLMHGRHFANGG